jgi:DNA-binding beta-propeller fold protein YncE
MNLSGDALRHMGRAVIALALVGWVSAAAANADPTLRPKLLVWGSADGAAMRGPRGVVFDPRDGAIYVANTGEHRIEVFSRTGRPLSRFVHRVSGPDGALVDGSPCALAFDRSGHLLVADFMASYVDVLDRRGRPVTRLDVRAGQPAALATGRDGTIYVGTTGGVSKVHRFHADYTPDSSWGEQGGEPGRLCSVTAIGELADGAIAVACAHTHFGIQIFTPTGEYLRGFGDHEPGTGSVSLPSGVVGGADGLIWVSDEIRQIVQVFDKDGVFIAKMEGTGAADSDFDSPSALAADGKGLMALTERGLGRFQVLGFTNQ